MKKKKQIISILIMMCIFIMTTSCSYNKDSKNFDTNRKSKVPIANNKNKIEYNIMLIFNNCEFDLNKSFENDSLEKLNLNELAILRNAIYAKHGYVFSNQEYTEYFQKFDWYEPTSQDFELSLTNTDNKNIKNITDLEKRLKKLQFKSSKLGFSISFPISWEGRYRIVEENWGLIVYFKPSKIPIEYGGEFFLIVNMEDKVFHQGQYDTVSTKTFFEAKDTKYFIGGPTDFPISEEHPELELFLKMKLDIPDILETIKPL